MGGDFASRKCEACASQRENGEGEKSDTVHLVVNILTLRSGFASFHQKFSCPVAPPGAGGHSSAETLL